MIEIEKAFELLLANVKPLETRKTPLDRLPGRTAAENVASPVNLPPFDRATMDGYAVRAAETGKDKSVPVSGVIAAGPALPAELEPGTCMKIMTGAPVPRGADAVVKVEDTDGGSENVTLNVAVGPGNYIEPKGAIVSENQTILEKGGVVSIEKIPLLAACGIAEVEAVGKPTVAVLTSGDEVVELGEDKKPGQISNANRHTLTALLGGLGIIPEYLGIARDDPESIRPLVKKGLESDVFIVTGGLSMGDYDHMGRILAGEGVGEHFSRVRIKPGKPTYFGTGHDCFVFGLPGNPVSVFVTFLMFVRPSLRVMTGLEWQYPPYRTATLAEGSLRCGYRMEHVPVEVIDTGGVLEIRTLGFKSSADVATLAKANAFAVLEPENEYSAGDEVRTLLFRELF